MKRLMVVLHFMSLAMLASGCQSIDTIQGADDSVTPVNQGYALIYDTIKQESQVDKILILKGPSEDVSNVLKAIAQLSENAKAKIDEFAKDDPALGLNEDGIPKAEAMTRKAISSTTTKRILFASDRKFEFNMLLAQHQAMDYISHLAGVLADMDTNESRKQYMSQLSDDAKALHERVIKLMQDAYVD